MKEELNFKLKEESEEGKAELAAHKEKFRRMSLKSKKSLDHTLGLLK